MKKFFKEIFNKIEKLDNYTNQYLKCSNNIELIKIAKASEISQDSDFETKGETLQISNQGGIVDFSIIVNDLGIIKYNENQPVKIDGTLLKKIGIEKTEFQVRFDLIIELENDIKLKTKITLDLPTGNILENGIETLEQTEMKTVFKRI